MRNQNLCHPVLPGSSSEYFADLYSTLFSGQTRRGFRTRAGAEGDGEDVRAAETLGICVVLL